MNVTYLYCLLLVPYGPQVLTLSSDPKVTLEVAIESGVMGFCVEKAGETAKKHTHPHSRHLMPELQWGTM